MADIKNVAFIPVRGGSKSIPLKNIKPIAEKPLVYWTVRAASTCKYIDMVYVATDSEKIKETVLEFGFDKVTVIDRSAESASDTASTESAMLEFAEKYEFENIVLVQATSPLLTAEDLDGGFELFSGNKTDSVLSVVRQKRFNWKLKADGTAASINYDIYNRPRRQDFEGYLVENGAFYITSRYRLLSSKNRLSGRIRAYEMPEDTYFEIDEPSDFLIIEDLIKRREACAKGPEGDISDKNMHSELPILPAEADRGQGIPEIKMFLTDCDGVLTDGGMYYSENGDELKRFCTYDGMGFKLLKEKGIISGIITGEDRRLNERRAKKLNIDIICGGVKDKLAVVKKLSEKYEVPLENIAYVGDDINDIDAIRAVGFGCCVANGVTEAKEAAKYISKKNGGEGAVREIADKILSGSSEEQR